MDGSGGFGIGKFFGIELQLHWTFIFLLVVAALFGGVVLFLFIVLLFAMVVVHEFAHSVTARRSGILVKKIVLFPLGGASIIDLEDVDAMTSFRIALAGPLTSLVLGFGSGVIAAFAAGTLWGQFFQLMFLLNIILGVFNLLPAFPLDGGRVLKSYLERNRDPLTATKQAVKVGNATIAVFIVGSIVYFSLVYPIAGFEWTFGVLWDIIIALFVFTGARAELEGAYIHKYASALRVSDAVSKNYILIKPAATMRQLYRVLLNRAVGVVLVQGKGGISIVPKINASPLSSNASALLDKKVTDFATPLPSIDYSAQLSRAIDKMRFEDTGIIAVTRKGKLAGVLIAQHVESIIALHLPHEMGGKDDK